jgi:CubicO group peptidase (beta-lactamase class C family)
MLVRTIAAVAALGVALPAAAQGIPKAQSPEEVGFVAARLKRLSDRIEEGRQEQRDPGRGGADRAQRQDRHVRRLRLPRQEAKAPMKTDAIFRIAVDDQAESSSVAT